MRFYFLRHPQTIANQKGLIYGWTDYDYTEKGEEMLEAMPRRAAGLSFDRIYASPLGRARKLAEAIGREKGLSVICDDRIKEMNYGILEGMDFAQAKKEHGEIMKHLFSDFRSFTVPQGESSLDVRRRAESFFDGIKEQEGACLVVTHAMFIHSAMSYLLNLDLDVMWRFRIEPCMIICLDYENGYGAVKGMIPYEWPEGF